MISNLIFQIFAETWTKDAFELIDYEDEDLIHSKLETKKSEILIRSYNTLSLTNNFDDNSNETKKLLEIESYTNFFNIIPNTFIIDNEEEYSSKFKGENSCWLIYKKSKTGEKQKKYKLNNGDIIKIGRITAKIKEIKLKDNNINKNESEKSNMKENIEENIKNIKKKKIICRICYTEEEDEENPLIQPCKCSGSMKYLHLNCLKHWIGTKLCIKIDSNDNYSIFKIKKIQCELCKNPFPDYIRYNRKLFNILEYNNIYKKYIVIESLSVDKRKNRFLYIGNLENKTELKVGRGHNVDLLFNDVSVSRIHFKLNIEKDNIFLSDNDSKFGSLVLVQSSKLRICESQPLFIQIGRSFIKIKLKGSYNFFSCCSSKEKFNEFYYQIQNEKELVYKNDIYIKEEEDSENDDNKINNNVEQKINFSVFDVNQFVNSEKEYIKQQNLKLTTLGDNLETLPNLVSNENRESNFKEI